MQFLYINMQVFYKYADPVSTCTALGPPPSRLSCPIYQYELDPRVIQVVPDTAHHCLVMCKHQELLAAFYQLCDVGYHTRQLGQGCLTVVLRYYYYVYYIVCVKVFFLHIYRIYKSGF